MYGHLMQIVQPPKQSLPKQFTRLDMTFKSVLFLCILGPCLESGAGQGRNVLFSFKFVFCVLSLPNLIFLRFP